MSETKCPTCGREDFTSVQGMKQHHSRTHGESISGELVSCDICDDEYRVKPCEVDGRHFCSDECQGEWMSSIETENHWNYKGGDVKLSCGYCCNFYTEIPSRKDRSIYCSAECRDLAKTGVTGENHPLYEREELSCDFCGHLYEVIPARMESSRFCSSECKHNWMSTVTGEEHPLYEGGEHNKYKERDWRIFSKKYRDWVGKCENCGDGRGNLQTHHDKPISMGGHFYDNTFTVLCTECHYGNFYKWHPPQLEEYIDR